MLSSGPCFGIFFARFLALEGNNVSSNETRLASSSVQIWFTIQSLRAMLQTLITVYYYRFFHLTWDWITSSVCEGWCNPFLCQCLPVENLQTVCFQRPFRYILTNIKREPSKNRFSVSIILFSPQRTGKEKLHSQNFIHVSFQGIILICSSKYGKVNPTR